MKSAIVNIMIRKIFLLLVFVAFYCRAAEGSNNNKPIVISWGDIDVRYSTHSQPAVKGEKIATLRGWKGERVSAVAEIWTSDTLKDVSYEIYELKNRNRVLSSSLYESGFVTYQMADELGPEGHGCGSRKDHSKFDSLLVADCIDKHIKVLDILPQRIQPLWLSIDIQSDAVPGVYTGTVTFKSGSKILDKLRIQLKVEDYELPSPYDWNFYLDLLQNPFAVARYENLPLWSDAQLEGKTLVTCGDSFTEGDFWDYIDAEGKNDRRSPEIYDSEWGCYKTYPYWIAKRNGMKLVNMAKCGATLALSADKKCECFVTEKLHSIPKDADYILFKFGINDSWRLPVGTIDDTTPDTFCGAWNIVLSWVIENCPDAKVGVIASNHCKTKEWSDATAMMCEKYGISCLNEESEDVPYFYEQKFRACPDDIREAMNAKYRVSEKNKHPNVAAHRIESLIVEKFLRTL